MKHDPHAEQERIAIQIYDAHMTETEALEAHRVREATRRYCERAQLAEEQKQRVERSRAVDARRELY